MTKTIVWMTLAVAVLLLISALVVKYSPLDRLIDSASIGDWINSLGALGLIGFVLLGALFTAFGLPRQVVAFIGGYSFGVAIGVFLGTIAALFGALMTFYVARYLARPFVCRKYPQHIAKIDQFVTERLFLKILLIRFLPFGTNLATNLAAGVTDVAVRPFALASFFGFIPQMLIFALTGHGINIGSKTQLAVAAVLFVISAGIGFYLYKHRRAVGIEHADCH